MPSNTTEKLAEEINGFLKEKCTPQMVIDVINAADAPCSAAEERNAAITHAVLGVAGTLLAIQKVEIEQDRIDGLQADLEEAVQVAYNRGAVEWAKLNYPTWIERLERNSKAIEERRG